MNAKIRAATEEMAGLRADYELMKEQRDNAITLIRELADALDDARECWCGECDSCRNIKALIARAREACHD